MVSLVQMLCFSSMGQSVFFSCTVTFLTLAGPSLSCVLHMMFMLMLSMPCFAHVQHTWGPRTHQRGFLIYIMHAFRYAVLDILSSPNRRKDPMGRVAVLLCWFCCGLKSRLLALSSA